MKGLCLLWLGSLIYNYRSEGSWWKGVNLVLVFDQWLSSDHCRNL